MLFGRLRRQLGRDEGDGMVPPRADAGGHPRFSVVIPAFNEQEFLGRCLASLAAQDYPAAFEIRPLTAARTAAGASAVI